MVEGLLASALKIRHCSVKVRDSAWQCVTGQQAAKQCPGLRERTCIGTDFKSTFGAAASAQLYHLQTSAALLPDSVYTRDDTRLTSALKLLKVGHLVIAVGT